MPNPLQKSLHGYFSKIKSSNSFSSSKNWVIAGCKHPKKLSISFKHRSCSSKRRVKDDDDDTYQESGNTATLSDIDRFLEENFKSLYIRDGDEEDDDYEGMAKKKEKKESSEVEEDNDYSHIFEKTWELVDSPKLPDSSPPSGSSDCWPSMEITSRSNSSTLKISGSDLVLPENCIAVLRYTEEPHDDFRRSMEDIIESKLRMREKEGDWDLMEELLYCYLNLNNKKSHRFILSAFADLIIALREK